MVNQVCVCAHSSTSYILKQLLGTAATSSRSRSAHLTVVWPAFPKLSLGFMEEEDLEVAALDFS